MSQVVMRCQFKIIRHALYIFLLCDFWIQLKILRFYIVYNMIYTIIYFRLYYNIFLRYRVME